MIDLKRIGRRRRNERNNTATTTTVKPSTKSHVVFQARSQPYYIWGRPIGESTDTIRLTILPTTDTTSTTWGIPITVNQLVQQIQSTTKSSVSVRTLEIIGIEHLERVHDDDPKWETIFHTIASTSSAYKIRTVLFVEETTTKKKQYRKYVCWKQIQESIFLVLQIFRSTVQRIRIQGNVQSSDSCCYFSRNQTDDDDDPMEYFFSKFSTLLLCNSNSSSNNIQQLEVVIVDATSFFCRSSSMVEQQQQQIKISTKSTNVLLQNILPYLQRFELSGLQFSSNTNNRQRFIEWCHEHSNTIILYQDDDDYDSPKNIVTALPTNCKRSKSTTKVTTPVVITAPPQEKDSVGKNVVSCLSDTERMEWNFRLQLYRTEVLRQYKFRRLHQSANTMIRSTKTNTTCCFQTQPQIPTTTTIEQVIDTGITVLNDWYMVQHVR